MSFQDFKEWVNLNPTILRVFDDTFHQDVWSNYRKFIKEIDFLDSTYSEPTERRTSNLPTMTEIPTSFKYSEVKQQKVPLN